jgi:hypothetical protein
LKDELKSHRRAKEDIPNNKARWWWAKHVDTEKVRTGSEDSGMEGLGGAESLCMEFVGDEDSENRIE